MDEAGHHVISLLSGHLGGANEWTQSISLAIDADPVITTATDVNGLPAPDVLARHEHLLVDDFHTLVDVNSAVVAGESVNYYIDETLVDANRLRDAAALHIGTHGMVQVVDVFTLPETDGVRRVVITDKVICEYTRATHLTSSYVYDGHRLSPRYAKGAHTGCHYTISAGA